MPHRWTRTNHKARVSETVARPTRTTVMLAVSFAVVSFIDDHIVHLSHRQDALLGISQFTLALGTTLALINAAWVAVENRIGKAVLRDVPPTKAAVVDDQRGAGELGLVIGVLLVIILVVVLLRLT